MKLPATFAIGLLAGAIFAGVVFNSSRAAVDVEDPSKKLLTDSAIDALDYIATKDDASAELVLATAVNAQIAILQRKHSRTAAEAARMTELEGRMKAHNLRLGLRDSK